MIRPEEVRFDPSVFEADAVLRAAHRLTGRAGIAVERRPEGLVCLLSPGAGEDGERLVADLRREVIDQQLRLKLERATEPVRRLVIAQAFSRVNLLRPEFDTTDPASDPARIRQPDERASH